MVSVADAAFVDGPVVIGWLRPVVLLPVAALAGLTPAQVEAILAHELAHVRRHDAVVNACQTVGRNACCSITRRCGGCRRAFAPSASTAATTSRST